MLQHRLLIVEGRSTPNDADVGAALALDGHFQWQRVGCDAFRAEPRHAAATDMVVAVAVPQTPEATSILDWLHAHPVPKPTVAVIPANPDDRLVRLASLAADELIFAPLRQHELSHRLSRLLSARCDSVDAVLRRLTEEMSLGQLVGASPSFVRVVDQVPAIARSDAPVLITGETGTGKELCARAIHHISRRRPFPFIAVDCGAIPDHLFENEMFGHVRGAFTDAHRDQKGLVALADGGTLFLDEVDALSLAAQAKLLRFLQERTFRPLGAERFATADMNVIAATNGDLDVCVREKRFRADLYFRLNVLHLHLPPLRERAGDVELLASHFIKEFRRPGESVRRAFTPAALRKLSLYHWPGNVREFFNVVQRAVVLSADGQILPDHIAVPEPPPRSGTSSASFRAARADAVAVFEREYIEALLRRHDGNVTRAAREAGKERRALGRLIKKHGIDRRA